MHARIEARGAGGGVARTKSYMDRHRGRWPWTARRAAGYGVRRASREVKLAEFIDSSA